MLHFLQTALLRCRSFLMLHFPLCSLFILPIFHATFYLWCTTSIVHSFFVEVFSLFSRDTCFHFVLFFCCTFFMLHFNDASVFPCCTVFKLHVFVVDLFFMLHAFPFALCSYRTLFLLHFFHVAPFSYCTLILRKILAMSSEYFNCKKQPLTVAPLYEKGVLKNVPKFTRKHPYRTVLSIHLLVTAKLFNTAFFLNTSGIIDENGCVLLHSDYLFSVIERNISVIMGVWVIWPPIAGSDIQSSASDLRSFYKFQQTQRPAS